MDPSDTPVMKCCSADFKRWLAPLWDFIWLHCRCKLIFDLIKVEVNECGIDMTHKNRNVCYRIIVHANAINELSFTNISFFLQWTITWNRNWLGDLPLYKKFALYIVCLYLKSQNEKSLVAIHTLYFVLDMELLWSPDSSLTMTG